MMNFWFYSLNPKRQEMNSAVFEKRFTNILNGMHPLSVIVTDNASYYSWRIEQLPTNAWGKDKLKNSLQEKGIRFKDVFFKHELILLAKQHFPTQQKYSVEEMDEFVLWKNLLSWHIGTIKKNTKLADVKQYLQETVGGLNAI